MDLIAPSGYSQYKFILGAQPHFFTLCLTVRVRIAQEGTG